MAAPNIVNVATITGKTAVGVATTSLALLLSGVTDKVLGVEFLQVTNVDASLGCDLTLTVRRSATDYHLAKTMAIPAKLAVQFVGKDNKIWLEEADDIYIQASAATTLEWVCSYTEIDDA